MIILLVIAAWALFGVLGLVLGNLWDAKVKGLERNLIMNPSDEWAWILLALVLGPVTLLTFIAFMIEEHLEKRKEEGNPLPKWLNPKLTPKSK